MYKLGARYKNYFTKKAFVFTLIIGVVFLLFSLVVNFYAGTYATESAGNSVQDILPREDYAPIRQDAVLMKKGAENPAATALLDYLKTATALAIIEKFGYDLPKK